MRQHLINIKPLIHHRDFRLLFIGQAVSFLGSMISYMAVPYQLYQLTQSSLLVGLLGTVQLIPLIFTGLYGGALADSFNRRKLLIGSEIFMLLFCFALLGNACLEKPQVWIIFVVSGLLSALTGFHRPAMEALTPQIVAKEDMPAIAALGSLRYSVGAIVGPALGGWLIAKYGIYIAYLVDALTFAISLTALWMMRPKVAELSNEAPSITHILEGFKYALARPELVGTYLVDMIAMTFAMPIALFPALSHRWGGATAAGWLYAAMPMGSIVVSLFSGAAHRITRHGTAVISSATVWGIAIVAFAFAPSLAWGIVCLALAGAADMVSGLYRSTIWNQTIPTDYRGRLASIEMLSYMSGPLLGNARAGFVASASSDFVSIVSGGALCVAGCLLCIVLLPRFWRYSGSTIN